MQIVLMQDSQTAEWDAFVEYHPSATFYHESKWKKVIEDSFGQRTFYLMARDEDSLHGILPFVHLKSLLFGSIFCSMPFLNFGGICADNHRAETALLDAAREIVARHNGDYLELRHINKSSLDLPVKTHKVSMTLDLDGNPDVIWRGFKSKHRTNIRRAIKNDLELVVGRQELLDDFYRIISIGWRNMGTPIYSKRFFENIVASFGHAIEIFIVKHRGISIATAFNGLHKDVVEGMWTYCLPEYSRLQTNYYLYWSMIEKACRDGFRLYHLGRSTNKSGATFFKKKWNANVKQLYWEYLLGKSKELPRLQVDNEKYQTAIALWRRLPLYLSQRIGPLLSKYIT